VARRLAGGGEYIFFLNHTASQQEVALPAGLHDAITKAEVGGVLRLSSLDGRVLVRPAAAPLEDDEP
jgi:beta-galactosidase GanA